MKITEIVGIVLLITGCFIIQPTAAVSMEELQSFLVNDITNERAFNDQRMPYYTCGHFTQDLVANASKEGIKMYPAYLNARVGCDHIIAAVEVNGTWVFIEPINDEIYPEKSFWALKRIYKGYWIGTHVRCFSCSPLSRVNDLVEGGMF